MESLPTLVVPLPGDTLSSHHVTVPLPRRDRMAVTASHSIVLALALPLPLFLPTHHYTVPVPLLLTLFAISHFLIGVHPFVLRTT